jgi:AraC-like DNA-binding protein/mannose-6-phosphate isomerase-like protein (cupin superfamily)
MARRSDQTYSNPRPASTYAPYGAVDPQLDEWLGATVIEPVSAIEYACGAAYSIGPRVSADSMWLCLLSGATEGWVDAKSEHFTLSPGDVLLVPARTEHYMRNTTRKPLDLISIHFHARAYGVAEAVSLCGFPAVTRAGRDAPFMELSKGLAREFALQPPAWRRALSAGVMLGLVEILRRSEASPRTPHGATTGKDFRRLLPAFEHIDRNLGNPELTVGEIARRVHMSEVNLRKLFARVVGTSPVRFVRTRRVEHACMLLRQTDRELKIIADECGFADPAFFYKVFKAETGTTPTKYRDGREV